MNLWNKVYRKKGCVFADSNVCQLHGCLWICLRQQVWYRFLLVEFKHITEITFQISYCSQVLGFQPENLNQVKHFVYKTQTDSVCSSTLWWHEAYPICGYGKFISENSSTAPYPFLHPVMAAAVKERETSPKPRYAEFLLFFASAVHLAWLSRLCDLLWELVRTIERFKNRCAPLTFKITAICLFPSLSWPVCYETSDIKISFNINTHN